MIWRIKIGFVRITLTIAPVTKVIGVNSNLDKEKKWHILMWDFDDVPFLNVHWTLYTIQKRFKLPNIYIFQTDKFHYIAYCFKKCTWREAIRIVACTDYVDLDFFKYGVYRGHFTLRISPKGNKPKPKLIYTIKSKVPEDVKPKDLKHFVIYETLYEPKQKR